MFYVNIVILEVCWDLVEVNKKLNILVFYLLLFKGWKVVFIG